MKIVRTDTVGSITMRLLQAPTHTCAGVDNYSILAEGGSGAWPALVRFLSTDRKLACDAYYEALRVAYTYALHGATG